MSAVTTTSVLRVLSRWAEVSRNELVGGGGGGQCEALGNSLYPSQEIGSSFQSLVVLGGDHDTESMSWMWLRRKGTPQTSVLNESPRWEENTPKVGLDRDSTMWREMKTTTRRKALKLRQEERILNVCPQWDTTLGRDDPESLSSGKSTWPCKSVLNEIPRWEENTPTNLFWMKFCDAKDWT